jgi:hypothetical protein
MHTADETAEIARELANVIHRIEKISGRYEEYEETDDIMSEVAYLRDTLETFPADPYEHQLREDINSLANDAVWITRNLPDHTSEQTYARSYLDQFAEIDYRGSYRPAVNRWELTGISIRINYAPNIQLYYCGGDTVLVRTGKWERDQYEIRIYAPHLTTELTSIIDTTELQAGCKE